MTRRSRPSYSKDVVFAKPWSTYVVTCVFKNFAVFCEISGKAVTNARKRWSTKFASSCAFSDRAAVGVSAVDVPVEVAVEVADDDAVAVEAAVVDDVDVDVAVGADTVVSWGAAV